MSVIKDDIYATAFQISQGDMDLYAQVTSNFLQLVDPPEDSEEQGKPSDNEKG